MSKFLDKTGLQTLWEKIKSIFLKKSGDTMTGRLTLERPLSQVITGTGIAAVTTSPYYPARWKFDLGIANPTPGDQLLIKIPVAGHDYGCFMSTDNGTTYYPVARSTGTTRFATQYGAGAWVLIVFEEYVSGNNNAGRVDNVFPPTGGTSRQNYTIGCWRLVNTRDDNDQYGVTEAYCSTGASTASKTATSVGYSLSEMNNIPFRIRFTNSNSAKSLLTLSINSQTAKNIYIDGAVSSSSNYTIPAGVYWCYYDGTQFQLWTDKSLWAYKYRGDGSSITETFTAASSRANIASGESNATIFGKIAKWLSDLKALAFKDAVSDSDISGTISDNHIASASTWNGKVDRVVVTDLADWDSLTETGIYEIESQAPGVEHSPESGRMTLIVINSDGYIVQFALGHSTFRREHPRNNSFGAWLSFPQLSASAIQLQLLYIDATGVINSSGIYTQDLHNVVYYPGAYVVGTLFSSVGHGTTYGFVGLYSDKSNDTPALQPSNPNTGDLAGDLNAIVYRNYGANVWSPTARGAKDFLIYIQSGGTKNFLFKDIIEHAPTARRFRLTFINYSTVLTPIRFCYDSNYNNGIEIFTNFGRAGTDTPVNYWLVDVPVNRSVAVDVSINYNSNSDVWVAALNITNDQRTM